jgi:uncharacterized membrane protein YpjA
MGALIETLALHWMQYTVNGIDAAMKHFFASVEGLLQAPYADVSLNNPNIEYIWEVRNDHMRSPQLNIVNHACVLLWLCFLPCCSVLDDSMLLQATISGYHYL